MLHSVFDNAPTFGADDVVGRFRSGAQLQNRPVALSEWRVTTGDPTVAAAIAELLGGEPKAWETKTEESLEILTTANTIEVNLEGLTSEMVLWGRGSTPIRVCDGNTMKGDGNKPCECPTDLKEKKEGAKNGSACQPNVRATFRLVDNPDLGLWRFNSSSWNLAAQVNNLETELANAGGAAMASLSLELVEFTTKSGRDVKYTKPVIRILTPAAA